jgi:hypothetical protein
VADAAQADTVSAFFDAFARRTAAGRRVCSPVARLSPGAVARLAQRPLPRGLAGTGRRVTGGLVVTTTGAARPVARRRRHCVRRRSPSDAATLALYDELARTLPGLVLDRSQQP